MSYGVNAPIGLTPLRYLNGSPWTGAVNTYYLPVDPVTNIGYTTNLGFGTPAALGAVGSGLVGIGSAGAGAADPSPPLLGAFVKFEYTLPDGTGVESKNWVGGTVVKAGTSIRAFVTDDPNIIFNVQTNSAAGLPATSVLQNVDMTNFSAVDATGFSQAVLDQTHLNNGVTKNLKILRLVGDPRNAWSVGGNFPYNNVEVLINNHVYRAGTLGN